MTATLFKAIHLTLALLLLLAMAAFLRGWRRHRAASIVGLLGCTCFGIYHALVTVLSGYWFAWSDGRPINDLADWVVLAFGPLVLHWVPLALTAFLIAVVLDRGPLSTFLTSSGWSASRRPLAWATLAIAIYLLGVVLRVAVIPYSRNAAFPFDPLPEPAQTAATVGHVLRNCVAVVLMAYAALAGRVPSDDGAAVAATTQHHSL